MEAGLGFTCDFTKPEGFVGMEAVQAEKALMKERGGLQRKLVQVLVKDPGPILCHGEVLWRNSERVGDIRAGSYGHSLGGSVGLSMVDASKCTGENLFVNKTFLSAGDWEIEIAGAKYPCQLSFAPAYDPKSLRVKS